MNPEPTAAPAPAAAPARAASAMGAPRFALVRHFALTSLVMFVLVAAALLHFMREQGRLFQGMQTQGAELFRQVQSEFAKQQSEAALRDLLTVHESGNVNLTRLLANALWQSEIAPFMARASQIAVDDCRAIADVVDAKDGKPKAPPQKAACFAEVGRRIQGLPGFDALNDKVFASMKRSTVFKVKVFDLRGITVYSSERGQVGEDKSANAGWRAAREGQVRSELTHRDKFSAFEGVVEKRDLISSYLPVLAPEDNRVVGVFEVYSDVTPLLNQIKLTQAKTEMAAATNQATVAKMGAENEARIAETSNRTAAIVAVALLLLFGALYLIVKRADRIIVQEQRERERAQQNLAQAEKMAALGQMVAGVAHQLNTPIAFSLNNVTMAIDALRSYRFPLSVAGRISELIRGAPGDRLTLDIARARKQVDAIGEDELDVSLPTEMLADTLQGLDQMRELVENLRDFTRLDRSKTAHTDLNKALRSVTYIAKSVIPTRIKVIEDYGPLQTLECNPSQLNQVFLNLINNAAQAIGEHEGEITVRSRMEDRWIRIDVADTGPGIPADVLPKIWDTYYTTKPEGQGTGLGLPIARSIVEQHGGEITVRTAPGKGTTFTVHLPAAAEELMAA